MLSMENNAPTTTIHQQFSIIARARSAFHLSAFEAPYIKTLKPILCRQKELSILNKFLSTSQHNANSYRHLRYNIYFLNTTLPPFYRFLCVSLTVSYIALNQSAASMTLYKPRHSFSHFILAAILEKC